MNRRNSVQSQGFSGSSRWGLGSTLLAVACAALVTATAAGCGALEKADSEPGTDVATSGSSASPSPTPAAAGQPLGLVLVGANGRTFVSDDAGVWRETQGAAPMFLSAVATDHELWVAVGGESIAISRDTLTWERKDIPQTLESVAWDGRSWVAVGLNGAILRSDDGAKWIAASADASWNLTKVAAGGGRWVAVGDDGTRGIIVSSDDGVAWSTSYRYKGKVSAGESEPTFDNLAWNGTRWVTLSSHIVETDEGYGWTAVGLNVTSTDGIKWTETDNLDWFGSAVGANGSTLLAEGSDGIYTSSDGLRWKYVSTFQLPFGGPRELVWDGREWLGYGESADVYRSADGDTWTPSQVSPDSLFEVGGIAGTFTN